MTKTNIIKSTFILGAVAISSPALAAFNDNFFFKPYVGGEFGRVNHGYTKDFGDEVFKKKHTVGSVFAGFKFHDYFGMEFGFDKTKTAKRNVTLSGDTGETMLGQVIDPADGILTVNSTAKFRGWRAGIVGELPIMDTKLSVLANVGLKKEKATFTRYIATSDGQPYQDVLDQYLKLTKSKLILRLSGGVQYFFTDYFGARALVTWQNTKKINPRNATSNINGVRWTEIKMRNSFQYTLGVVVKIPV